VKEDSSRRLTIDPMLQSNADCCMHAAAIERQNGPADSSDRFAKALSAGRVACMSGDFDCIAGLFVLSWCHKRNRHRHVTHSSIINTNTRTVGHVGSSVTP